MILPGYSGAWKEQIMKNLSPNFLTFKGPRNRFLGIDFSAPQKFKIRPKYVENFVSKSL
jgi:hypothetical protein